MGSFIELNDTLQITASQGFPVKILNLKKHRAKPIDFKKIKNKIFSFHDKPNPRIYHLPPCRCFLVENINGKWLYWGKILMLEQTIKGANPNAQTTSGKYKIIALYDPPYQEQITRHECPVGKSYFST
jgi:hypothetical protein